MRPSEVLEQTFLLLDREDIEVTQISHRRFHNIISSESFHKVTPLLTVSRVELREDHIEIWRKGVRRRFAYDSEETIRWLRNACVEHLGVATGEVRQISARQLRERSQRWLVPKLAALRVITIDTALPFCDQVLHDAFLRPNPAHHWTSAQIRDGSSDSDPPDRLRVPLLSSSLANTESLSVACGDRHSSRQHLRVSNEDLLHWLHRPQASKEAFTSTYLLASVWERRKLSIMTENIDGDLQQLIEGIREKFLSATTKLEYDVSISHVSEGFKHLFPKEGYRKFNMETGELLRIELLSPYAGTLRDVNDIAICRRPFF